MKAYVTYKFSSHNSFKNNFYRNSEDKVFLVKKLMDEKPIILLSVRPLELPPVISVEEKVHVI